MGAEALSKVMRRDIRRAYAPEASEEVLKFVAEAKGWLQKALDTERHNRLNEVGKLRYEVDGFRRPSTFFQRLRWLVTGTWAQ